MSRRSRPNRPQGRSLLWGLLALACALFVPASAHAQSGGPDSFGYRFTDSGGYRWDEATSHPGYGAIGNCDDCTYGAYNIGFNFDFYGTQYSQITISSNGFIMFGGDSGQGCCSGRTMPDGTTPWNLIAASWTDLYGGTIYYVTYGTAPNRRMVIQWNTTFYANAGNVTSQIVLEESGNFQVNVQTMDINGHTTGAGIENSNGSSGLTIYLDSSTSHAGKSWYFTRQPLSGGPGGPYLVSQGQSVTLAGSASGGVPPYSFAWDTNNDGSYGEYTGSNPAVPWNAFGGMGTRQINVRITDGSGSVVTGSTTINVGNTGPSPSFSWTPANPALGTSVQFIGNTGDPGDGTPYDSFTYAWDFGDGTTSSVRNPAKSWGAAGSYVVRFTVRDAYGAQATTQQTAVVWGASAGGPYAVSQGGTVQLQASSSGNPAPSYQWDLNADGVYGDATGPSPTVAWSAFGGMGSRPVSVRVTYAGLVSTAGGTVTVSNVAPQPSFTYNPAQPANGVAVTFTGNVNDPGESSGLESYSYAWDFGDGTTSTARNPAKAWASAGNFTVRFTVTDSNGGAGTTSTVLTVWGASANGPYTVNQGQTVTLNGGASGTTGASYQWDLDGDGIFGDAMVPNPTVPWTAFGGLGVRTVSLRVTSGSYTSTSSTTVTVNNVAPSPSFVTSPLVPPRGAPVAFTLGTGDPGEPSGRETYSYQWAFGDGNTSTQRNPIYTYTQPGTYQVQVTVRDSNGASGSRTQTLTVWAANAGGPYVVPVGGSLTLAASAAGAPATASYAWDLDGDGVYGEASGPTPTLSSSVFGNTGSRTIGLRVIDGAGGVSTSQTTVGVWGASAGGPYTVNQGQTLQLQGAATGSGWTQPLQYAWDLDGDGVFGDSTAASPSVGWKAFGSRVGLRTATLRITDATGARATAAAQVQVNDVNPTLQPSFTPDPPHIGEALHLTGTFSDPGSDGETYAFAWDFGDGTTSTQQSPTKTYLDPGTYTVRFTVTDSFGGVGSFTRPLTVVNVAPAVTLGDVTAQQMTRVSLRATVTSLSPANTAAGFNVTWDYGDGSAPETGRNLFQVTHVFQDAGSYTVRVTAVDAQNAAGVATAKVTSTVVAPTVTLSDVAGKEGSALQFNATVTHVSPVTAAAGYTTKWEFGDGSQPLTGKNLFAPTKTYDDGGLFTVKLTVTDKNGGQTVTLAKARIGNVAPVVVIAPVQAAAAGSPVRLTATVTSSSKASTAAGFQLGWNFGDGQTARAGLSLTHAFCAGGQFPVTLTATDKDGMSGASTIVVNVANTPPRIVSAPQLAATEGKAWQYALGVVQPGCERLSYSVQGPAGMTVSPIGLVTWIPTYQNGSKQYPVVVRVQDGSGGSAQQQFVVAVSYRDDDHDGVPDTWEQLHGKNSKDPHDAIESPFGDGRTNREKWVEGLDPTKSAAPGALAQTAPADGAKVGTRTPTLEVSGPEGSATELVYEFEVFQDAQLTRPVTAAFGSVKGTGSAKFVVPVTLEEDHLYWWRARAFDGTGEGPYTGARRMLVSAVDNAPGTPAAVSPVVGSTVTTATPALVVAAVTDPEADDVHYEFELYADDKLERQIAKGAGQTDGQQVRFPVANALADHAWFWWHARAIDAAGNASAWSPSASFQVSVARQPFPTPQLVAPLDRSRVQTRTPTLVVASAVADALPVVTFVLDTSPTFDSAHKQESPNVPQGEYFTSWTPAQPLEDHTRYYWKAVVVAGPRSSEALLATFTVNVEEVAPTVPTPTAPVDGASVDLPMTLSVQDASDVNGDKVSYDFEVLSADGAKVLARKSAVGEVPGTTGWLVDAQIPSAGELSWHARAVDETGRASEWTPLQKVKIRSVPVGGCSSTGGEGLLALVALVLAFVRPLRRKLSAPAAVAGAALLLALGLFAPSTARAQSGGPDAYGYRFNQVGYTWDEATSHPGYQAISNCDDCVYGAYDIGFNFNFYGNTYSQVYISSNGFLMFGTNGGAGCCTGYAMGVGSYPANMIAASWSDMLWGNIYFVTYGTAPNRKMVIQWNTHYYYSGPTVNSQIVLEEAGSNFQINLGYQGSDGHTTSAGFQNSNSSIGLTIFQDSGQTRSNLSWYCTPLIASPGGPYSVQEGGTLQLLASAPSSANIVSWQWDFNGDGNFNDASGTNPTASWTAFGGMGVRTIALRVTDNLGRTSTSTTTVNVVNTAPAPSFTWSPNRPANGTAIAFTGNVNDPGEGNGLETYSYAWDFGDGSTSTARNPVKAFSQPGTYNVRFTVTDSAGGSTSVTTAVGVWGAVISGSNTVLQGQSITLQGSSPTSTPVSYSWDLDGDGLFGDATVAQPTVPWTAFGGLGARTVTLRVTDGTFASTATSTVSVVNVAPAPTFVTAPLVPARGAPVAFTVATGDPGEPSGTETYTFSWTFGDGGTSTQRNPVYVFMQPGTYPVQVSVRDSNGAGGTRTQNVTVWAAAAGGPYSVAQGGALTLAASALNAPGPVTATWDLNGDGVFGDAAGLTPLVSAASLGGLGPRTVSLRVVDAAGGVSVSQSVISVWGAQANGPYRLSQGQTVQLQAATIGSGWVGTLSYSWDLNNDGVFGDNLQATPTLGWTAFGGQVGPRTVGLRVSDQAGHTASATAQVQVDNVNPSLQPTFTPDPPKVGETMRFTGTFTDPGSAGETYSFRWDFGDGTSSTQQSPSKVYLDPGSYTARYTVTDSFGGVGTFTRVVTVLNVAPTVTVADATGAQMSRLTLTARVTSLSPANTSAGFDVTWDYGDGSAPESGKNLFSVNHVYQDAGSYTVRVTAVDAQNAAGVATAKVTSTVVPPTVQLADVTGKEGAQLQLSAVVTHVSPVTAAAGYTTKWEFGDGSQPLTGKNLLTTTKTYDDGGTYSLKLTVTDKNGGQTVAQAKAHIGNVSPTVTIAPVQAAAGSPVRLTATVTSPSKASTTAGFQLAWNFGDGHTAASGLAQTHAFCAAGTYPVTLTATDKDGMSGASTVAVNVVNTPPRIVSAPVLAAQEGLAWRYAIGVVQPGCERLSYSVQGPAGMTVNAIGVVSWTPTYANGSKQYPVVVQVQDGSGGSAQQQFVLAVSYRDDDHDGVPDTWEQLHGKNSKDPHDAIESPFGDGRTNREKWVEGLDPTKSAAPGALAQTAPADGAKVGTRTPTLEVTGPEGSATELVYEFEVFQDAQLTRPVTAAFGSVKGTGSAKFVVPVTLEEDHLYWWRARAFDGTGEGPYTLARRMLVSAVDNAPGTPAVLAPLPGSTLATATPQLVVSAVTDPEADDVNYEFEVFSDPVLEKRLQQGRGTAVDGRVGYTPATALADGSWVWWHARALDAQGHAGAWSTTGSFQVQVSATLPAQPQIVVPLDGSRVKTTQPALTVSSDFTHTTGARTVVFTIDTAQAFDSPEKQESQPVEQGQFLTSWTPAKALTDHTTYYWKAVAHEGDQASQPVFGKFFVNVAEVAPVVPAPKSPLDGQEAEYPLVLVTTNTNDVNGDAITYDFELLAEDGTTVLARKSALAPGADGTTTWAVDDWYPVGKAMAWHVRAVDQTGLASDWSTVQKFHVHAVPTSGCSAVGGSALALMGLAALVRRRRR